MSESEKMSSPYAVLENRSIDQWKVTDLKEELKRRNLLTKGLKDDLVKRLDEAIRSEIAEDDKTHDNGVNDATVDSTLDSIAKTESSEKDNVPENLDNGNRVDNEVMISEEVSNGESKSKSETDNQVVYEVSQVTSDSISIDSKEVKDNNNVIADDVKLEVDVKPETESVVFDDENKITTDVDENKSISNKNDNSEDINSPEKFNLDKSSGDDSMEEDALQIDSSEKTEAVLVMVEDKSDLAVGSTKRKLHAEQETETNSQVVKKQHRWNSEQQTTPKGSFQPFLKNSFSRSDSSVSQEEPKERVVPPSSKPPTTSLRIDRFQRPFTLKAVQEFLDKSGTVVSFWMDHIKTHCYVTYTSVEEAVETRNTVYNLQWPKNGGKFLIADFVDPSEVKTKTEPPLPPPPSSPPVSLPPPPPPLPAKVDPPAVTLDDLFRKTRATPRVYYLPLTEDQIEAKL